jgi:thioredoxin 1
MREIKSAPEFNTDILRSERPVLVDFFTDWCAPCKATLPILEQLETEYAGRVDFVKVNSEQVAAIAQQYRVRSLPTILILHRGVVEASVIGMQGKAAIVKALESVA